MSWLVSDTSPTLDASSVVATMDGWSLELSLFIVSATVTVNPSIDKVITWPTT